MLQKMRDSSIYTAENLPFPILYQKTMKQLEVETEPMNHNMLSQATPYNHNKR